MRCLGTLSIEVHTGVDPGNGTTVVEVTSTGRSTTASGSVVPELWGPLCGCGPKAVVAVRKAIASVLKCPALFFDESTEDPTMDTPVGTTTTKKVFTESADSDLEMLTATPVPTTTATEQAKLLGVVRGPGAPRGLTEDLGGVRYSISDRDFVGSANFGYEVDTVVRTSVMTAEVAVGTWIEHSVPRHVSDFTESVPLMVGKGPNVVGDVTRVCPTSY